MIISKTKNTKFAILKLSPIERGWDLDGWLPFEPTCCGHLLAQWPRLMANIRGMYVMSRICTEIQQKCSLSRFTIFLVSSGAVWRWYWAPFGLGALRVSLCYAQITLKSPLNRPRRHNKDCHAGKWTLIAFQYIFGTLHYSPYIPLMFAFNLGYPCF